MFPGAIYSSQSSDGQIVKYKSSELKLEQRRAILIPIEPNSPTFTIAESEQEVKLIEALAEPKTVKLSLPNGELKLTLGWGEIKTLVRGYRLCVKQYCNCEAGCPRCLYLHSCPQDNESLNKQIGLKLLEAMF